MENLRVAWILKEIADLMELKGENPFKIRAYRQGSERIEGLSEPLIDIYQEDRLQQLPGIGNRLSQIITEILEEGESSFYQQLKEEIPRGLIDLLDVSGIGPKKALLFHQKLGISDLSELEAAAQSRRLRALKGIGSKTELRILEGIDRLRSREGKVVLGLALKVGMDLVKKLKHQPFIHHISLVGETRRRKELVEGVELLISSEEPDLVLEGFSGLHPLVEVIDRWEDGATLKLREGLKVTLRVVSESDYWLRLLFETGSSAHLESLQELADESGFELNHSGLVDIKKGKQVHPEAEEDIYQAFDLPYIIPELREGWGEIRAAREKGLPDPITADRIRGDLHLHTTWSDGGNSIKEMAEAAQKRGYQYLAICDHSPSLQIAGGLSRARLEEQIKRIEELNASFQDFRILTGVEVDINSDLSLDHPEEILSKLDVVVASIHTGFRQDEDQLTARLLKAVENDNVDIIGHPSGRLLGRRAPYSINLDLVLEAAAWEGKVLEINASPDRLDLSAEYIKKARDLGIKLAINTDAHSISQLDYMQLGVAYARRGWLEAVDVINTLSLPELMDFLSIEGERG